MLSVGALIWISLRPLIRLVICAGCGFAITKADIFPPIAARGAGQVMLASNIALPCLMFSKIVPAFTSDNISALGPLILVAVLYEAMGISIAWVIKQFFWVPHRFRYGLLVAGGWGNYGDIPTSVLMSLTGAAPFNGTQDQTLSVAYISAFILVFMVTLFPCGGHTWIAMDYVGPDIEREEVQEAMHRYRKKLLIGWLNSIHFIVQKLRHESVHTTSSTDPEKSTYHGNANASALSIERGNHASFHEEVTPIPERMYPTIGPTEYTQSHIASPAPTITVVETSCSLSPPSVQLMTDPQGLPCLPEDLPPPTASVGLTPVPSSGRHCRYRNAFIARIRTMLHALITPASLAIIIAFPIAVIPQLKALFVDVPGISIHPAPDGQPPLAFIMDTATFIGGASVPLGLICLGSALARLKIPRNEWSSLPLGAIAWLAIGKLIVMPVLGVLICQGLVNVGVIDPQDKVLRFVCIFFSCLPTATTQVFLTQVYSGTGTAEHLSAFLIPQYIIMFLSITALTAYTLQLLF